ncbi:MarR family winged helix-turn-helix transcriptional regulator [Janibacter sp. G1551]|uniref:MarR family winged helix-turn-helix transcriptional regulator n=1 Tax=Janibacter sp. G1551 TaxID=3420440 RepID=UPI003CFC251C
MSGRRTDAQRHRQAVATYVAAGGDASTQRVITALTLVARKLDQWYEHQLVDLGISQGEWTVLSALAKSGEEPMTPTQLAEASLVAASSMTHRLDRMGERGLVRRAPDPSNRTRVLVHLTKEGWDLFARAVREADVVESDVLAGLSGAQRRQLGDLLEVVIGDLDRLTTD